MLVVTSLNDSGTGTLRDTMLTAAEDDIITFDSSLSGSIVLASSLPTITVDNLLIYGPNSLDISIDGGSLYQIFHIANDQVTIANLNLINGADPALGGAVYVEAGWNAALTSVNITSCSGANCASPVYLNDSAYINIVNSSFTSGIGPDLYLVNSSATITNTNSLITSTLQIDGVGVVETKGPGSVNIQAFSTPIDIVIYNHSGTCQFSGTTDDIVIANGTLMGTFTSYYVASSGTIQPGDPNTLGTVTSNGSFVQDTTGNLQIKITPSGTNDLVAITGSLYPEGTLTILPQSGMYIAGTSYTIITTTQPIDRSFPSILCPITGFPFSVIYHPNSIEIVITTSVML